ncbi:hypothetical protein [Mesorhizobium sp. NZP2077]|uniref:hypothetical protein n=1 Tax=Mesorhizobium sp. NZP2077 TaxID=2483404 RepID=UPI0015550054|nr:hypothetical protein [Mesorhizobium sp. NZP2077]QKC83547.1 hypothetical protein EB232_19780 [Mesorhizobium sp. NZP2077]QKD17067.1 hypothetical protein HGP13_19525 [Mesorhizobium sp. NZP2077]
MPAPDHAFANDNVIFAAQFEEQEFIALGREDRTRQDIERALDDAGLPTTVSKRRSLRLGLT